MDREFRWFLDSTAPFLTERDPDSGKYLVTCEGIALYWGARGSRGPNECANWIRGIEGARIDWAATKAAEAADMAERQSARAARRAARAADDARQLSLF